MAIKRVIGWMSGLLAALVLLPAAMFAAWMALTPVDVASLPSLKDGDLVFQSSRHPQSLGIAFATISPYTHVGMIRMEVDGTPVVVEAVGPVREIALKDWLPLGIGQRVTVARLRGLAAEDARKALSAARALYGRPYDIYFLPDDDAIYCSELVHKAFARGSRIMVGREQKIGDLFVNNFAVEDLMRRRWRTYQPCHGVQDYDTCRDRIFQQSLVSPASILEAGNADVIYSNYGPWQ